MKNIKSLEEFITEGLHPTTYDGKKPSVILKVNDLTYEDMLKQVDPSWGAISLPVDTGEAEDFTIYVSDKPGSPMENKYRKEFVEWKNSVINKWGKTIEIFKWNEVRKKPIFAFIDGSSAKYDKENQRINGLKYKQDPEALHNYYHGPGSKGRYFGD